MNAAGFCATAASCDHGTMVDSAPASASAPAPSGNTGWGWYLWSRVMWIALEYDTRKEDGGRRIDGCD